MSSSQWFNVTDDALGLVRMASYVWNPTSQIWVPAQQASGGGGAGGDVTVLNFPAGFLAEVTNFPSVQPVSGTFWQATQPVSFSWAGLTDAQLRASPVPVSGSFTAESPPDDLALSATGAAAAAVTLTIPAVGGQFARLKTLAITMYSSAARTGNATPIVVTSTNLGGLAWTFPSAGAIGTILDKIMDFGAGGLRGAAANTATTIVCPGTANVIWRVNATYRNAA